MKFGKPVIKVEAGKAYVELSLENDGDNDGKASITGKLVLEGDVVELLGEVLKKEPNPMIAMIIQNLKV